MRVVLPFKLVGQKLVKGRDFPKSVADGSKDSVVIKVGGIPDGCIAKGYFKLSWENNTTYDLTFDGDELVVDEYIVTLPAHANNKYIDYKFSFSLAIWEGDIERLTTSPVEIVVEKSNYSDTTTNTPDLPENQYNELANKVADVIDLTDDLNADVANHEDRLDELEKGGKLDVHEVEGYAFAVSDEEGNVALGIKEDGEVDFAELGVIKEDVAGAKEAVSTLEKTAEELNQNKLERVEISEYAYAISDDYGRVAFAITDDGEVLYADKGSGGDGSGGFSSIYEGKSLSVYGDSISTFTGYVPAGNRVFYTGNNCGVTSVDETWWMRAMTSLGMELCVNNSWSGRCVSNIRDAESGNLNSGGYALANVEQLATGGVSPDVIIVKLGVNDFRRSNLCPLGSYDGTQDFPTEPTSFREAYAIMLKNILSTFPNAEVWCCTIMENETANDGHFPQLDAEGNTLNDWNDAIRDLASLFSVNVLDHASCGITYWNLNQYMGDYDDTTGVALHPNANGHALMSNKTVRQMDAAIRLRQ